jgi:hypothetical protein
LYTIVQFNKSSLQSLRLKIANRSSDGTKLAATSLSSPQAPGQIYTSTDSGQTWTAEGPSQFWSSITSSADGMKLAAFVASLTPSSQTTQPTPVLYTKNQRDFFGGQGVVGGVFMYRKQPYNDVYANQRVRVETEVG